MDFRLDDVWVRGSGEIGRPVMLMGVAISLYKHPNARKGRYCAICLDRTRGATQLVRLPYGVEVHLCGEHASLRFQTMRMGRDG